MRPRSRRCAAMRWRTRRSSRAMSLCCVWARVISRPSPGFEKTSIFAKRRGWIACPRRASFVSAWMPMPRPTRAWWKAAASAFLRRSGARITPLDTGLVALDCAVTPCDNSQSKTEGVSRTDKREDGYAPMAAYLGQEGYCLEPELRAGSQHCRKGTPEFLRRVIGRARQLSAAPLLRRPDSGNDAIETIAVVGAHNAQDEQAAPVHDVIKCNPRKESPETWLADAEVHGDWSAPRPGKRVALFEVRETRTHAGYDSPCDGSSGSPSAASTSADSTCRSPRSRSRSKADGRAWSTMRRRSSPCTPSMGPRSSSTARSRAISISRVCPRASSPPTRSFSPAPCAPTTSCAG